MRKNRARRFLPYLLIAVGAYFLFQGARVFFESGRGQFTAKREFEHAPPPAPPSTQPALPKQQPFRPRIGETVGKLIIPRLGTQIYFVEGVDARELLRGPGHIPGTAMPGVTGNCVIAAHRDTHFRVLKDIRKGDDIVLMTREGEYLYRVKSTQIVSPKNLGPLQPTPGPVLNLITCYPFYYVGSAPKRFIVEAELAGSLDASLIPRS
jgi:sortase A